MDPLAEALARSPDLFPAALDPASGTVTLVRLSRADYEQASFLDGRIMSLGRPSRSIELARLVGAVEEAKLRESCNFIFHLGHVGSTLLSRLLGRHENVFSLREPEILRTLAQAFDQARLESQLPVFLKLWSRTFEPSARALVKATSFTSDLAATILARPYAPKALLMGVNPETYLATIFGGANAPAEAKVLAPFRLARLERRLGGAWSLDALSLGEIIAMSWACEALALAEARDAAPQHVHVLDFDRFLAQPGTALLRAFAHFEISVDAQTVDEILSGPELRTYSKAPEHEYSTALRTMVLSEGRARHAAEIRRGLLWLDRAAQDFPQLASVLGLFG
jgi:hypothetical protein